MDVYFVRHGQTDFNAQKLFFGITNPPLNANGEKEAKRLSEKLGDIEFEAIYCSPLIRAKTTAMAIKNANTKSAGEVISSDYFCEINFGDWEGLSFDEIIEKHEDNLKSYLYNFKNHTFSGGQSTAEFFANIKKGIDEILAGNYSGNVLIVTHVGVIGCALNYLLFKDVVDIFNFNVPTGGCAIVRVEPGHNSLQFLG